MFNPIDLTPPLQIPHPSALQTEFVIRLSRKQAALLKILADRAGASAEEVLHRLATMAPFTDTCPPVPDKYTETCPITGAEIPLATTPLREWWLDYVLYCIAYRAVKPKMPV